MVCRLIGHAAGTVTVLLLWHPLIVAHQRTGKEFPQVELIGVCFDGMGRLVGQAHAPSALRTAGLQAAFASGTYSGSDVVVSEAKPRRDPNSDLLNEDALLQMVDRLYSRVSSALSSGRFPVVYGGDCSVLLAAIPALRDSLGEAGLVFLDGHEDATPMEMSPNGEAGNMEIGLLTGLTGEPPPLPLRHRLPALRPDAVAMVGQRDDVFRRTHKIPTMAGRVLLRSSGEVSADPVGAGREAARHVRSQSSGWWLHIDFDVLARSEFSASGAPEDILASGGLTWPQLTAVASSALEVGGCRGWSLVPYNPDLDPERRAAARIVRFVDDMASR